MSKRFADRSIRSKLIAIVMLTTATALLLACAGFIIADLFLQHGSVTRNLETLAKILAANSTASIAFGDHAAATEVLGALHVKESIIEACIYDERGAPFAAYFRDSKIRTTWHPSKELGSSVRGGNVEVVYPIKLDGKRIGTIDILSDMRLVQTRLVTFAQISFVIIVLALFVARLMIARLQRVITNPIIDLAHVAETVSREKNYSIRAAHSPTAGTNEIGNLIGGFNEMLGEIERRDHGLESLVAARTAELSATSRNMEMILDSAGEGIFGLDMDGIATFINPSAARMLGWDANELIGKRLHNIIHPQQANYARVPMRECLVCSGHVTATRVSKTDLFSNRSGETIPVEYDACTITMANGERGGVVVTFRDITERLVVDKMKSEFVSTVSHELRTPLTSIRGALGLLAAGLLGKIGDKGQRMLDIAISNTDRLVRLINDILDIERMDAGRVELHRKLVDVHDVMVQSADVMQAMAERSGITLTIDAVHESLWIDPDRIVQLLTNLLSNAIKFSSPGGHVILSGSAEGRTFIFRVKDEGRGIPKDKLDLVFERFKQVDASDSRDKGGTGLGLAICRSIAAMHGGRIWANSAEGKGSTFQFTVPMHVGELPAESIATQPVERTILVCEEDRSVAPSLVNMLERHGMHTLIAASRDQLFDRAEAMHPDAVILNVTPSSDGWRVIERLKASESTRDIPVIVATMNQLESVEDYAGSIAGWVKRPYDEAEVLHAITIACHMPTILVVEDDLDLARVMTTSLESHGIRTIHAATGRAAIEAIADEVPDLIVLDLILPEMDGFAVVDWLKRTSRLARIPLIVYSAIEVTDAQQEQLRLGPTEFLTKSRASLEEFEEHVVRLLCQVTAETEVESVA
jgi:PAS domain S-box-containing protein